MVASLRVIVVDDYRDCADSTVQLLGVLGPRAEVAYDAGTALSLAAELKPDLMLVDLVMPIVDGFELARRLQELPPPHPIIVAVTGYGDREHQEMAADVGFSYVLLKPVGAQELLSLLQTVKAAKIRD